MKSRILLLVTLLSWPGFTAAAWADCIPPDPDPKCTLLEIYNTLYEKEFPPDEAVTMTPEGMAKELAKEMKNESGATTAPDPFASRVHASFQDFLNLLSFAVNKVEESEDGQALIVRFNPLRHGSVLMSTSLTAARPTVAEFVKEAIPETSRPAVVEKLEESQEDLDDLTYAIAFSWNRQSCSWETTARRCWGRAPDAYRDMLAVLLTDAGPGPLGGQRIATALRPFLGRLPRVEGRGLLGLTVEQIPEAERNAVVDAVAKAAEEDIERAKVSQADDAAQGLDELSALLDNQPQLAGTVSYRDVGSYGGKNETAVSMELQYGLHNLNTLRRSCKGQDPAACGLERLQTYAEDGVPTDKFVLTASFHWRESFTLSSLDLDEPVEGFQPIALRPEKEYKARIQYGRFLSSSTVGGEKIRFDFAGDLHRAEGGLQSEKKKSESRAVGTLTLTVPLGDNMSVPLSISYANKPEFLGEPRKKLGVHLGLTYRLPWEPAQP